MERGAQAGDGMQDAMPIAVAALLDRLLKRIEMDDERIRADHLHRAPRMVAPAGGEQLRGTEIGEQQGVRRPPPQLAAEPRRRTGLHRDALGADPERDAQRLRRLGKVGVDGLRARRPAGHGADEQRGLQPPPEHPGGKIDGVETEFRQRAMDEAPAIEPRVHAGDDAIAGEHDIDVVFLAPTGCVLIHAPAALPIPARTVVPRHPRGTRATATQNVRRTSGRALA